MLGLGRGRKDAVWALAGASRASGLLYLEFRARVSE